MDANTLPAPATHDHSDTDPYERVAYSLNLKLRPVKEDLAPGSVG